MGAEYEECVVFLEVRVRGYYSRESVIMFSEKKWELSFIEHLQCA